MSYQNILVEISARIATVTLNRPQVLNVLNRATMNELAQVIDQLGHDDNVRCIILTGAGEKAFAAGADINELRAIRDADDGNAYATWGQDVFCRLESIGKPVIAAINGYALGGGCELIMACDMRLAADAARLGQPEVNLGIIPGFGGTQRLPRLVGRGVAKWLIFSGEMISAQEAWRIGLVDWVVPAAELTSAAMELAGKLTSKAPIAIALAKQSINLGTEADLKTACAYEASLFGLVCGTQDHIEGTSAFLQKRVAQFTGR